MKDFETEYIVYLSRIISQIMTCDTLAQSMWYYELHLPACPNKGKSVGRWKDGI